MGIENNTTQAVWEKRISEQAASGLSREAWCIREGFHYSTFRYWIEKIRKLPAPKKISAPILAPTTPTWLELSPTPATSIPPSSDSIIVRIGEAAIDLRRGFDPELLREIMRALVTT